MAGSNPLFIFLVIAAQAFGIASVVLMGVWMGDYQKGFGWGYKNPKKFNYHPLFMVIGLIFLYGDAILVYRVFRNEKKIIIKILHMVMQLAAFGFAVVALKAVFSAHNDEGFANLYSLHSWIGLATVIMFGLQFVLGFTFYLFPTVADKYKSFYMSMHRYWGTTIFCMAIVTALMGIVENTGFKVDDYSQRSKQAYIINFLGVCIVVFGWLVTFLVTKPEYKRENPTAEHSQLINSQ